jgi:aspartate/methionine/tyrosine aminotransferase
MELREAVAGWLARRHGVRADPATQIQILIGSKEGLAHLPLAYVDEGDNVLVPDLGYPVYSEATILAGGEPRRFRLEAVRDFRPDPAELTRLADTRTRLVYTNYPNNPTGAVADTELWRALIALCCDRGCILVNDAAYLEVNLDGNRPQSMLGAADLERKRLPPWVGDGQPEVEKAWKRVKLAAHEQIESRKAIVANETTLGRLEYRRSTTEKRLRVLKAALQAYGIASR